MKRILNIIVCLLLLSCYSNEGKDDIINEIESNIKIKLPKNIRIISNKTDGAIGDYTSISKFEITDKASLTELICNIKKSKVYFNQFPGSIPHDTEYYFWYRDEQNYIYENNGNGSKQISLILDTITGIAQFSLHED